MPEGKGAVARERREDARRAFGGGRVSRARHVILAAIAALPGAFTVEDLLRAVRDRDPRVGIATVYRAVSSLESSGFLEAVGARSGSTLYVGCGEDGHHHHVVCTGCGRVARTACPVDHAALSSAVEAGFTVTAHEVTVYGLCARCSEKDPA